MTIHVCPRCQQRYARDPHSGDFVHECQSQNLVVDQEDIEVRESWNDYGGSGAYSSFMMAAGAVVEGKDSKAYIHGARIKRVTARGNSSAITRSRQHFEYVEKPV